MLQSGMASPRKPFVRALGELTRHAIDPMAAKAGFGQSDILVNWPEIAGERLAAVSEPQRLQWPVRAPNRPPDAPMDPANLVVLVEGAFALEVQHVAPLLIERINARLGWRCVGRLVIRQGPVRRRARGRVKPPPPPAAALAAAEDAVADVADENLRQALARLGARALTARTTDKATEK